MFIQHAYLRGTAAVMVIKTPWKLFDLKAGSIKAFIFQKLAISFNIWNKNQPTKNALHTNTHTYTHILTHTNTHTSHAHTRTHIHNNNNNNNYYYYYYYYRMVLYLNNNVADLIGSALHHRVQISGWVYLNGVKSLTSFNLPYAQKWK